jgi:phage-related protein
MPSVATGVGELRVRDENGIYRMFYYTASARGILVFHAFVKKTHARLRSKLDLQENG